MLKNIIILIVGFHLVGCATTTSNKPILNSTDPIVILDKTSVHFKNKIKSQSGRAKKISQVWLDTNNKFVSLLKTKLENRGETVRVYKKRASKTAMQEVPFAIFLEKPYAKAVIIINYVTKKKQADGGNGGVTFNPQFTEFQITNGNKSAKAKQQFNPQYEFLNSNASFSKLVDRFLRDLDKALD